MKYYELQYADGTKEVVSAKSDLELIRKYDLATIKHIETKIVQLGGDQLAAVARALENTTAN